MFNEYVSRTIKFWSMIGLIIIVLIIAGIIMFKYDVEGEKKLPYKLSKITIISTAEGIEDTSDETDENAWNLNVIQINDVYISIDKTEFAKENQLLSGVRIENIQVTKSPARGGVRIYMPISTEGRLYNYSNDYLVQSTLQYKGASKSNPKTLEIGNQGGLALISFSNTQLGKFKSVEKNVEIRHDGTLVSKINEFLDVNNTATITQQDIEFSVSFDLVIKIDNNEYKGTVSLDLPCGNVITDGTGTVEITDFSNVVFKKI